MSWTMKDGHPFNTNTGATATRSRSTFMGVGLDTRRGRDKTTGAMEQHRERKREQAEVRNAETPYERTAQSRRDVRLMAGERDDMLKKAKSGKLSKRQEATLVSHAEALKNEWEAGRA